MPLLFLYIYFSVTIHTVHSYNHSFITFALLHIFIAAGSVGGTSLGCRARFELGPAIQHASALTSELRCTLSKLRCTLWATLHPRYDFMMKKSYLDEAQPPGQQVVCPPFDHDFPANRSLLLFVQQRVTYQLREAKYEERKWRVPQR